MPGFKLLAERQFAQELASVNSCYAFGAMQISDLLKSLGQDSFGELIRTISIGKLKTYQLYDPLKARTRVVKLNTEGLRKATGRLWERVSANDDDLSKDLVQAVLLSNLPMIISVLNFLEIPHNDGFFADDIDPKKYLKDGWAERVLEHFKGVYPDSVLRLYVGHLAWETTGDGADKGGAKS